MALTAAAVVLLLGLVGRLDYEAQEAQQEHYCDMVKARLWPDYQGIYRSQCRQPSDAQW